MLSHYLKFSFLLVACFCSTLYAHVSNPVQFKFLHPDEKVYLNCSQKPYSTMYDSGPLLTFTTSSAPSIYYNYQLAFPTYADCMMAKDEFAELYDTLIAKKKPGTYTIYARTDGHGKAHFQIGYRVELPPNLIRV